MGEAKRRGTFEERKAQSVARQKAEDARRFKLYQERMSPTGRLSKSEPELQNIRPKGKRSKPVMLLAAACMAAGAFKGGQ